MDSRIGSEAIWTHRRERLRFKKDEIYFIIVHCGLTKLALEILRKGRIITETVSRGGA